MNPFPAKFSCLRLSGGAIKRTLPYVIIAIISVFAIIAFDRPSTLDLVLSTSPWGGAVILRRPWVFEYPAVRLYIRLNEKIRKTFEI